MFDEYETDDYKEWKNRPDTFEEDMKRELSHCFSSHNAFSDGFPSGEMAELSFMQGGFPDDDPTMI